MIRDAITESSHSRLDSGNLDQTGHAVAAVHQYKERLILELIYNPVGMIGRKAGVLMLIWICRPPVILP
jgi:hypothetical protein